MCLFRLPWVLKEFNDFFWSGFSEILMYYSVIFFTIIIFVIILHITPMIVIDVVLQCSWFRDGFSTRNIYESDIAYLLMACSERFSTWNTFVIKFLPWIVSWICLFRDIRHRKRLISFVTTTVWFLLGFCWHTWSIRCYFFCMVVVVVVTISW